MISKEEAKAKLRKAGYSVVDDNSVITVVISEKGNIKNTVKAVKELFIKIDYNASFGVKQSANSILDDSIDDSGDEDVLTDEDAVELSEVDAVELSEVDAVELSEVDAMELLDEAPAEDVKPVEKKISTSKKESAVSRKDTSDSKDTKRAAKKTKTKVDDDDFFDEEDELDGDGDINLDSFDMDMLLNEESIQFSLEDFGMM